MPWLLSLLLPWIVSLAGTALVGLVAKWLHSATILAKLNAKDAHDQDRLDDLEHLLDVAVEQAISRAGQGVVGKEPVGIIAKDALDIFKSLASPQLLADLEVVLRLAGSALWPYLLARITGKAATAGKVLTVPPGLSASIHAQSLAQQRALVGAAGTTSST